MVNNVGTISNGGLSTSLGQLDDECYLVLGISPN